MSVSAGAVTTGAVVAPLWRRSRFWLALAGLVLIGAVALTITNTGPGRPLDPRFLHP